jgi:hypothetical protein
MNKPITLGATVAGAALLAKVLAPRIRKVDFAERIAAMPDTSPRKWVFTNIAAIRANTERILALLEPAPTLQGERPPPPRQEVARDA